MERSHLIKLVEQAKEHDQKAIEELYRATYSIMYSLAMNLCANHSDTEDILQESYIRAFSKLDTLAKKAAFINWMKKIVVNVWHNYYKNQSLTPEANISHVSDEALHLGKYQDSLTDIVEQSEINRELRALVEALPENQQTCMLLFYYENMKIEEIADVLDITYTAAWKQIFYTLQYDKGRVPAITGSLPATRNDIALADLRAGRIYISETKPQSEGYTFVGWKIVNNDDNSASKTYNAADFGNMTDAEKQVNEALFDSSRSATAVAQWVASTYTVTYKAGGDSDEEYTDTDISGDYTLLGIDDVRFTAPEAMSFDRWVLVTPDDKDYPPSANGGDSINVISDVTYQAAWSLSSPASPTATITYTSGLTEEFPGCNESCASPYVITQVPTSVEYPVLGNDPNSEDNPSFAPDGYAFAGWKLVSTASGSSPSPNGKSGGAGTDGLYHEGDTVATNDLVRGNITLRAMWNCKLRYDANEGTGTLPGDGSDITQYVGDNVTAADGSHLKQGSMSFAYWSTSSNDETGSTHYSSSTQFVIKEDTVLYAIYDDAPHPSGDSYMTVTYDANGGKGHTPQDNGHYQSGDTVNVLDKGDLTRSGCTFRGWNTRPDGSGTGYKGDGSDSFVIRGDTTLYAVWVDGNGQIIPSPGTGENSLPFMMAVNAALLSLAAIGLVIGKQHRKNVTL